MILVFLYILFLIGIYTFHKVEKFEKTIEKNPLSIDGNKYILKTTIDNKDYYVTMTNKDCDETEEKRAYFCSNRLTLVPLKEQATPLFFMKKGDDMYNITDEHRLYYLNNTIKECNENHLSLFSSSYKAGKYFIYKNTENKYTIFDTLLGKFVYNCKKDDKDTCMMLCYDKTQKLLFEFIQ